MNYFDQFVKVSMTMGQQIRWFRKNEEKSFKQKDGYIKFRKSKPMADAMTMMVLISDQNMSDIMKDALVTSFERVTGKPLLVPCDRCNGYRMAGLGKLNTLRNELPFSHVVYTCVNNPTHNHVDTDFSTTITDKYIRKSKV